MAGSDKNTRGSNPGRSAAESSQPISETESHEVAGKLLTSLKSASTAANAISHEAKLGMAVITILFFAFCFLVYHKMDLHQRQLTQASIASKAGTPDANATPEEASALMSGNVTGATTDPLLERSLAATDNAITTREGDVPAFAQPEAETSTPNFGASAAMEFSEPYCTPLDGLGCACPSCPGVGHVGCYVWGQCRIRGQRDRDHPILPRPCCGCRLACGNHWSVVLAAAAERSHRRV